MRIVLDTNVLLVSIPRRSTFRAIFDALLTSKYTLMISQNILEEYEEIIAQRTTPSIAQNIVEMLIALPNVEKIEIYYRWHLIQADPDDNKFTDTAIAGQADYLVSNDAHFNVVKQIVFPQVTLVTAQTFLDMLKPF